jgi:lipoprotein-releasing system permease protein
MSYVSRLALGGLVLSITVLLVVISVVNGFEREMRVNVLGLLPHLTVIGYGGMNQNEVTRFESVQTDTIRAMAPFIQGTGLITANGQAQGVSITGIDVDSYGRVSRVIEYLDTGAGEGLNLERFGVILGHRLARDLGVGVGDRVVLVLPAAAITPAGVNLRKRAFTVIDTFSSNSAFESTVAYIGLGDAQKLFRLRDRVHGVHVRLDDLFATTIAREEISALLGPDRARVRSWISSQGNLYQAIAVQKLTMFILLSFLVGVAAFNLASGLVMIVEQRKGDVAILRSMGADTPLIVKLFSIVGILLSVVGIVIGIATGVLLASALPTVYETLSTTMDADLMSQYFISYLPVDVRLWDVVGVAVTALCIAIVATLYPAWRAARLLPSQVLAHE